MCITCGCSSTNGHDHEDGSHHDHDHQDGSHHHDHKHHDHEHDHHNHAHKHHANEHQHNKSQDVIIEEAVLGENENFARKNLVYFSKKHIFALNLVSSPGTGKTTFLQSTIEGLIKQYPINVIEGDQHTDLDAQRIIATGANAYQINTKKVCHLDGHMISHALASMNIPNKSLLFIENVGNLICPTMFNLGEHARVVLVSVTEGEDKPLKYPDIFKTADVVVITKIDLLPYLKFDLEKLTENIKKINRKAKIIQVSTVSKEGMQDWYDWLGASFIDMYGNER